VSLGIWIFKKIDRLSVFCYQGGACLQSNYIQYAKSVVLSYHLQDFQSIEIHIRTARTERTVCTRTRRLGEFKTFKSSVYKKKPLRQSLNGF